MPGFFSGSTTTTRNPFETNPWDPQQGYLTAGFADAATALDRNQAGEAAVTDYTANMTPEQQALIAQQQALSGGVQAGAQSAQTIGQGALGGLTQFGQNANSIMGQAGQDHTGQIISNANQFANNPQLQAQIDGAIGDVNRGFQMDVGNINSDAAATGNMSSTRAGVTESLARDNAMDRAGQISSQMRGAAWQQGLGMASDNIQSGIQNQMGANGQVLQGAGAGMDMMSGGYNLGSGALQDGMAASGQVQNQNQAEIDGQLRQAGAGQTMVGQYMQNVGGNYGSNGYTSTSQRNPSIFQQLVGGAATVMGGIGAM